MLSISVSVVSTLLKYGTNRCLLLIMGVTAGPPTTELSRPFPTQKKEPSNINIHPDRTSYPLAETPDGIHKHSSRIECGDLIPVPRVEISFPILPVQIPITSTTMGIRSLDPVPRVGISFPASPFPTSRWGFVPRSCPFNPIILKISHRSILRIKR